MDAPHLSSAPFRRILAAALPAPALSLPRRPLVSPRFTLRVLGGLALLHADGRPVDGRAAHRHPLALLARLALAGAEGVTRDKLAGLLWPDRDEAAARHRLRGALHELRQLLGPDALPTGGTVRLAGARLAVDVHVLLARHAADDPAGVVAAYTGPFLDGFFLDGAAAFEEWASAERGRLAGLHAASLERLAVGAAAQGDAPGAARWWRALAAARPADGRVALATVEALAAAGDPAGAIAHAVAHARHLDAEFGVAPDRALSARVAALRAAAGPAGAPPDAAAAPVPPPAASGSPVGRRGPAADADGSVATPSDAGGDAPGAVAGGAAAAPADGGAGVTVAATTRAPVPWDDAPPTPDARATPADAPRQAAPAPVADPAGASAAVPRPTAGAAVAPGRRRMARLALACAAVALAALAAVGAWTRQHTPPPTADAPTVLAIAPFELVGAVPGELREGLPALLTANLDQVPELRLVAGASVARRTAGADGAAPGDPAALAHALGAEAVVTGLVAPVAGGVVVEAALVDTSGTVRLRTRVRADAGDVAGLVDRLSLALLRELWGRRWRLPEPQVAAITTADPVALRAYLVGERLLRAARWDSARAAFVAAVDADSTFAMAHLRLHETYGWWGSGGAADAARALDAAQRHAGRLAPRERGLLAVRTRHAAGDLATVALAEALVERYPLDAEVRYVHADALYHAAPVLGASAQARAVTAFDAALAVDSTSLRVLAHPTTLALWRGDRARFDRLRTRLAALEHDSSLAAVRALAGAVRFAPPAEAPTVLAAGLRRDAWGSGAWRDLTWALRGATLAGERPAPSTMLAGLAALRAGFSADSVELDLLEGYRTELLTATGRLQAACPLVRARPALGHYALPVILGYAPPDWCPGVEPAFAHRVALRGGPTSWLVGVEHVGFALVRGDAARGRALLREVGRAAARPPAEGGADPTRAVAVRGLLHAFDGWARVVAGDTAAGLAALDAGIAAVGYEGILASRTLPMRLLRDRLRARDAAARARALDGFLGGEDPGQPWAAIASIRACALAAGGDAAAASRERVRAAALWAGADPAVRARVAALDARCTW